MSVFEAPIEDDACRGGDEREHDESRCNVVGCLAEDGREQARAEYERGQASAHTNVLLSCRRLVLIVTRAVLPRFGAAAVDSDSTAESARNHPQNE